jgi:2-oxoglutarate dehydrogenase E2 component (dihydrolipoamide succinyltransferase)
MKKQVHLGIAVSVDHGVMVPVIRGAGSMTIAELAQAISRVAEKARGHQLSPDDVAGGTITMTNFGMAKTMIGVPIIRHPEVAIVGIGAITRKVVPLADDSIAIRSIMWVTLTFDHRVLDGLYGCGFLSALRERLESNR